MADKQRRFTDEFKREAIRLVDSGDRGIERTARHLCAHIEEFRKEGQVVGRATERMLCA
jgi:transposase-like protein